MPFLQIDLCKEGDIEDDTRNIITAERGNL